MVAVFAIGIIAGGYYLVTRSKGGGEELEFGDDNYAKLVGNKGTITGEVSSILRNDGERIIVSVVQDKAPNEVQVVIPSSIDGPNINLKQSYIFTVKMVEGGFAEVTSYVDR